MEILAALFTKEVIQIVGPILGVGATVFYIYFKGKRSGAEEATESYRSSKEEYEKDIKSAEQYNMNLEKERNEKISKIKSIGGKLSDLISLFNKTTRGGKAASRKTRKK